MINKQNLWFLTLFSLILILGVYYITLPSDIFGESLNVNKDVSVVVSENDKLVEELVYSAAESYIEDNSKEMSSIYGNTYCISIEYTRRLVLSTVFSIFFVKYKYTGSCIPIPYGTVVKSRLGFPVL